jgi:hypothetical protein
MKEKFIPGIYNYCDRWCERCTFTSRCRNYESTSNLSPEQLDINNKAFWDNISFNFQEAIKLIDKEAKKQGLDLSQPLSPEEEKKYEEEQSRIKTKTSEHDITGLCKQYQKLVIPYVNKSGDYTNKVREMVSHGHLGITTPEEIVHTVAGIGDCFDIIQWYVYFIDAKMQRALRGKIEGEDWEVENGFAKDSDGSAKIAIIAVGRSMEAWIKLYELLPSSQDTALTALSILSRIKQKTLEEFPGAMDFKRPGFDD